MRLKRALPSYSSESWDLICNCKQSQSNLGFGICEIEEGPLSPLKWLLRLDLQLQTESEQFGIFDLWDWGGPSLPTQVTSETCFGIANRVRAIWDSGFGICEIEEDSLSLLKWLLRLDMQLQTESEQFGTCSPLNNKWHFHGLKLDLCAIVLSSYAF